MNNINNEYNPIGYNYIEYKYPYKVNSKILDSLFNFERIIYYRDYDYIKKKCNEYNTKYEVYKYNEDTGEYELIEII